MMLGHTLDDNSARVWIWRYTDGCGIRCLLGPTRMAITLFSASVLSLLTWMAFLW